MAVYRAIYMSFWTDSTVDEDYSPEDKYFMLYALTNPHTNVCGCYEVSVKQISQEMGYSRNQIEKILDKFREEYGTILYDKNNRELYVKNWYKYNWNISPKLDKAIRNEILHIKTNEFRESLRKVFNSRKSVVNGLSAPIEEGETAPVEEITDGFQISIDSNEESVPDEVFEDQGNVEENFLKIEEFNKPVEKREEKEKKPPYDEIKDMYHQICVSYPKLLKFTDKRRGNINARWRECGGNIEIFKLLFEKMQSSSFLRGQNKKGWSASFDWAMLPDNFTKIIEGKYDNRSNSGSNGWDAIRQEAWGDQG